MKAPFPWFGGKRRVAPWVWEAFGDVDNYVEPFAGSLAVLLERPAHHDARAETVNDADSYLANFWRALINDPEGVAHHANWPVNETDLFARHHWLVNTGRQILVAGMEADPDFYDAKIAGWWVWGVNAWIGSGWCSGTGPWKAGAEGRIARADNEAGVKSQLPHLGDAGQGVNRKLPHLGDAGRGVNRKLPHLGDAGRSEPTGEAIRAYMEQLAWRLRRVRVCCGDWSRVVTTGALTYGETVGVFLDPPYLADVRTKDLYATDDNTVANDVREWAVAHGDDPRLKIILAGYEDEHEALMPATWRRIAYSASKSYGSSHGGGVNEANRHKERLWLSPSCEQARPSLFGELA